MITVEIAVDKGVPRRKMILKRISSPIHSVVYCIVYETFMVVGCYIFLERIDISRIAMHGWDTKICVNLIYLWASQDDFTACN